MSAKAERERQEGYYHVMERAYGASECVIRLPISVDESGAHARHKRGVMYSTLPLSTEHQSRLSKAVSEKLVIREGGPKWVSVENTGR